MRGFTLLGLALLACLIVSATARRGGKRSGGGGGGSKVKQFGNLMCSPKAVKDCAPVFKGEPTDEMKTAFKAAKETCKDAGEEEKRRRKRQADESSGAVSEEEEEEEAAPKKKKGGKGGKKRGGGNRQARRGGRGPKPFIGCLKPMDAKRRCMMETLGFITTDGNIVTAKLAELLENTTEAEDITAEQTNKATLTTFATDCVNDNANIEAWQACLIAKLQTKCSLECTAAEV